jgi:uncharacterized protein (TIGR03118 family)
MRTRGITIVAAACLATLLAGSAAFASGTSALARSVPAGGSYTVTKLVSDQPGEAKFRDPNLVNAWGLAASSTSPWWVANNHSNTSTLYDGDGTPQSLVVKVGGGPTGTVFNGSGGFEVHHNGASGSSIFIFDNEAGKILGWNPNVPPPAPSTRAFVLIDRSKFDAIYKGLAIATSNGQTMLYAADFHNNHVDVFNSSLQSVIVPGAFTDPKLPKRFAPFGIQAIGDRIFVAYAKQDADAEDEVAGAHLGYVDMYDTSGVLLQRVATRGPLDAPWGLAMAPDDFGQFSGDLLVGNFGDGRINAFREQNDGSWTFEGHLMSGQHVIGIEGLWALEFGNGGNAGPTNSLYFTAGPADETHGLFGSITAG